MTFLLSSDDINVKCIHSGDTVLVFSGFLRYYFLSVYNWHFDQKHIRIYTALKESIGPSCVLMKLDINIHSMIIQGGPKKPIPKLNQIDIDTNDIFRTNFNAY